MHTNICGNDGGTGIGAGHRCKCTGVKGHDSFGNWGMVHGCQCGALWTETEVRVPIQGDATKFVELMKRDELLTRIFDALDDELLTEIIDRVQEARDRK